MIIVGLLAVLIVNVFCRILCDGCDGVCISTEHMLTAIAIAGMMCGDVCDCICVILHCLSKLFLLHTFALSLLS